MPTAAIDLLLASSAMILLVMGAIYGVNTAVEPYLEGGDASLDRYQQIGRHMLLSRGEPENWGVVGSPTALGFSAGKAYELDIDKVTRLNPSSAYAVGYPRLWEALGIDDVSFHIRVDTLFNVTLSLVSSQAQGGNVTYTFAASTARWGYPLPATVRYYVVIGGFTASATGTTASDGSGTVEFTLPGTLRGTALLVAFARVEPSVVSYGVLPFAHNSTPPEPAGTFATLSPLNYTLSVNLAGGATVVNAAVLSLGYMFNLTGGDGSYSIPHLLDASPIVLALTGVNGSDYWAEWAAYPQLPLAVGADMSDAHAISDVASVSYLVEVKGTLYRFKISFRSPVEDD